LASFPHENAQRISGDRTIKKYAASTVIYRFYSRHAASSVETRMVHHVIFCWVEKDYLGFLDSNPRYGTPFKAEYFVKIGHFLFELNQLLITND